MLSLPVNNLTASQTVGGAVTASGCPLLQHQNRRTAARESGLLLLLYAMVRVRKTKQRTARGPTVHQPALVQDAGLLMGDAKRMSRTSQ